MFPKELLEKAENLLEEFRKAALHVATAESCTGGLVIGCLTEIPGASDVVERGFVTYSNDAKTALLGVPPALIARAGAVSEAVARAMAEGALRHAPAELAVAITGVAGPEGGTAAKPVGLVHFAVARRGAATRHLRRRFAGDRTAVRLASVECALELLRRAVADQAGSSAGTASGAP